MTCALCRCERLISGSDLETHSCSLVYPRDRHTIIYYSETFSLPPTPFSFLRLNHHFFFIAFFPSSFWAGKETRRLFPSHKTLPTVPIHTHLHPPILQILPLLPPHFPLLTLSTPTSPTSFTPVRKNFIGGGGRLMVNGGKKGARRGGAERSELGVL